MIQKEKVIHFEYESKMPDIGLFKGVYLLKRETPKLRADYIRVKSALAGGNIPLLPAELQFIDTVAALNAYVSPCDQYGKALQNADGWIDEILDRNILFEIHVKLSEFHNSFYEKKDNEAKDALAGKPAG